MGVFVIAEAGVNHNGDIGTALEMINVASEAGASACKFQVFRSDNLVTKWAPKAVYQQKNTNNVGTQLEMLRQLELNRSDYHMLSRECEVNGIELLITPFDVPSIYFLTNDLGLNRLKIASGEVTNAQMLVSAAQTQCEVILSTGMSSLGEIKEALGALAFGYLYAQSEQPIRSSFHKIMDTPEARNILHRKVTVLHCVSQYPAPVEEANLLAIPEMRRELGTNVGFSDHTMGLAAAAGAVALGATVVEKHFTLSHHLPGPDHLASAEPQELSALIGVIRDVEAALGDGEKKMKECEKNTRDVARRSLVADRPIKAGEVFSKENITAKRPGGGLSAMDYWDILGTKSNRDYDMDDLIRLD